MKLKDDKENSKYKGILFSLEMMFVFIEGRFLGVYI